MEIHASLAAAVPNAIYVEHIPQLRAITRTALAIEDGMAVAPETPGLGIDWDMEKIEGMKVAPPSL
jgi:L-alanine-DL-glutamate epimerase-like enolase superfamily enzyme